MQTRLGYYMQRLRESLWFVPGLMVLGAFGLACGLITFDANAAEQGHKQFPLLFGVGADGSRGMLTAIAGSMLTVAALTFSLTLSTLSQVSNQYSPRILRTFMRDPLNQIVMGYFVSVFTYCLIVLGSIRSTDEGRFVPATAVLVSLVLALGGVVALITFIHHIAESLQTGTIIRQIFTDTIDAIDHLFPSQMGEPVTSSAQADALPQRVDGPGDWHPIRSDKVGYLQHIDKEGLLHWATDQQLTVRQEQGMGAFVGERTLLFSIRPDSSDQPLPGTDQLTDLLTFANLGLHRNIRQDVAFGIQQLVDIAVKALSAGINDPTTAIMTIDYLGTVGAKLAQREFPARLRSDGQQLRVQTRTPTFDDYMRQTFDLPRINAKGDHAVMLRLLRALAHIRDNVRSPDRLAILREQVHLLLHYADDTLATEYERKTVHSLADSLRLSQF